MKGSINTEKPRNTPKRNERRPQNSPAPHVRPHHEEHQSPEVGEPTNRRLNGTGGGGAPHGAKRPHLRIIVYISSTGREDQPLIQYGWKLEESFPTIHGDYIAYTGTPKQQFIDFPKEITRFLAYIHGGWGGGHLQSENWPPRSQKTLYKIYIRRLLVTNAVQRTYSCSPKQ